MPTVATSPSTLVHSCEGMYFKPSITVRVATREARSSVFALRASRLLASPSRASRKGPIRTFYPRRVSARGVALRASSALVRSRATSPTCHARASLDASSRFARASSRAFDRASDDVRIVRARAIDVSIAASFVRGRRRSHRWSTRARRPRSRTWARTRSFASSISRAPIAPTSRRARSRIPSSTCARRRDATTRRRDRASSARRGSCVFIVR